MIAALVRFLDRFRDPALEQMVRQARLTAASDIARAIRRRAPAGHSACTSWPHCTECGRESQAESDALLALEVGRSGAASGTPGVLADVAAGEG